MSVVKNVDNRKVGVWRSGLRRGGNERGELEICSGRDLGPVSMSTLVSVLPQGSDNYCRTGKFWIKKKFSRFQILYLTA